MKKILIILLCFMTLQSFGQGVHTRRVVAGGGGSSYSTEVQAVFDIWGVPTNAQAYADCIDSLVSQGHWTSRNDRIWIFGAEDSTDALVDILHPSTTANNVTINGATTFTTLQGFTGGGTADDTISLNVNLSTTTHFTTNDAGTPIYILNNISSSSNVIYCNDGTNTWSLIPNNGGNLNSVQNQSAGSQFATGITTSVGLWTPTRYNASETHIYQGATERDTDADASSAAPDANAVLCFASTHQVFFVMIGDAKSTADVSQINIIVEQLKTDLGI